ncbi:hypothetical protein AAG906_022787 [Vitis piasezkii]
MTRVPYANIIGSIMYAMICTRLDLAYAVSIANRYMWIMRYISVSLDMGLVYGSVHESKEAISGYVDADFSGCIDSKRSLRGYIFTIYGEVVNWKACLQKMVALSTTQVEYILVAEGFKEALRLKGLTNEMGIDNSNFTIYCDSQSAIHLMKNPTLHERSKHIDVKYHFIREVIE